MNDLLPKLRRAFIGLDNRYPLADGSSRQRIYLDSSASTLMMKPAYEAARHYLRHYANTHTSVHTSARITAQTMAWASETTLAFVGAEPRHYLATFLGSGATAAINRAAAGLAALRPERDVVLVSSMEHHSN
ncbi:MAG TPA: aminotransferase class V-fold PLP-dependent enzyme, partial [Candidatus Tenderia sp.]|nr:aminotransferase class V-fold PLP-dependent enzyme [Candidatus Tenderia sp.]